MVEKFNRIIAERGSYIAKILFDRDYLFNKEYIFVFE